MQYVEIALFSKPLVFQDTHLRAIDAKQRRDFDLAIASYQLLSSQQVSNPMPHYFLGKLYLSMGQYDLSHEEFQKAEVKAGLLKDYSFPELFFAMGQYFEFRKDNVSMKRYYRKTLDLSQKRVDLLTSLKDKFKAINDQKSLKQVKQFLANLEAAAKQKLEQTNTV
eukprot:COSAG01_NODE_10656_length_2111_cov_2.363817_4_plen_165_part_01